MSRLGYMQWFGLGARGRTWPECHSRLTVLEPGGLFCTLGRRHSDVFRPVVVYATPPIGSLDLAPRHFELQVVDHGPTCVGAQGEAYHAQ
jgi:hypothetical protein